MNERNNQLTDPANPAKMMQTQQKSSSAKSPRPQNKHSADLQNDLNGSAAFKEELRQSRPDTAGLSDRKVTLGNDLVQAKEIPLFNDQTVQFSQTSSPVPRSEDKGKDLEGFTIDDENKSFEEGMIDEEDEERAVADFVSEIELNNGKTKLRQVPGSNEEEEDEFREEKNEGDERSQQYSFDDVTDDEEGNQEEPDCPLSSELSQLEEENSNSQKKAVNNYGPTKKAFDDRKGQQVSTAYDSATNGYSSSSYDASKKNVVETHALLARQQQDRAVAVNRLNSLRPDNIKSPRQQAEITENASSEVELKKTESVTPMLKEAPSKASLRKQESKLDKENFVSGHLRKFLAHVETREVKAHYDGTAVNRSQAALLNSARSKSSHHSKSSDSGLGKDNEDPNAPIENQRDFYDPKELREDFEGWSLYKKTRISFAPVRRYQYMVDQDYKKNKVTVCAHMQNIYNTFCIRRGKATPQMNNYFDIDRWAMKMEGKKESKDQGSPTKVIRRENTLAQPFLNQEEELARKENFLLTKSNSTAHIPENARNKNAKRFYANYDKELAVKMFGYRVVFQKADMSENKIPLPGASQTHKPLQRYVSEIMSELTANYQPIHRYHTKQRILIPLHESDEEEEAASSPEATTVQHSERESVCPTGRQSNASNSPREKEEVQVHQSTDLTRGKKSKKLLGDLVVLKTRLGEKQTFLKRNKNLLWHCAPPERQQSATSNAKRQNNAKNGSAHGSQYINNGSPTRTGNTISPKKLAQSQAKPAVPTQTTSTKNVVRYAPPKQGNAQFQHSSALQRFGSNSGAGNQNFNHYRRQNSYRKGQKPRIDSAKGSRGMRQSMESQCNPAYRLINQQPAPGTSSDQYFTNNQNGRNCLQDQEVAQITSHQEQSNNVVYLKDPKHIQGFGSNVVHVNVSCGQTVPENPRQQDSKNKAAAQPQAQEDEDSQTFIIQLSEEQTRQLANGSLKLNGVPIPKDLSNLTYEQIMALLDSVNFPAKKTSDQNKTTATQQNSNTGNRQNDVANRDSNANGFDKETPQRRAPPQNGKQQLHKSNNANKSYNSSFISTNSNMPMANTLADSKSLAMGQTKNFEYLREQQTYYAQGGSLVANMTNQILLAQGTTNPFKGSSSMQGKPGRELVRPNNSGARSHQNQYTGVPLKGQRIESASRRNRAARQTTVAFGTKNEDMQMRHQRMRQQKGRSVAGGTTDAISDQLLGQTRNAAGSAGANCITKTAGGMGNSEWNMLTMLQQQQQQLKNAQQFLQHSAINLEHQRKLQSGQQLTDMTMNSNEAYAYTQPTGRVARSGAPQIAKGHATSDGFNRATLTQIQQNSQQQNAGASQNTVLTNVEQKQPFPPNSLIRSAMGATTTNIAALQSQQMSLQQYQLAPAQQTQAQSVEQNYAYARQSAPAQQSVSHNQKRSMTRLNSKKRLSGSRKTVNEGMQNSSSRSFLKANGGTSQRQPSARASQPCVQNKASNANSSLKGGSQMQPSASSQPQPNLLFSQPKVNSNLLAHENQLISNHQQQIPFVGDKSKMHCASASKRNLADMSAPVNTNPSLARYYQTSGHNSTGASFQHSGHAQDVPLTKAMSAKNQMSKTSIELEYSKFENNSTHMSNVPKAQTSLGPGLLSNIQTGQGLASAPKNSTVNERAAGVTNQFYNSRITEADATGIPAQKLRINQQALNNNLNYSNQSSNTKRKIDSALAQSAMNAIQIQNAAQHVSLCAKGSSSPFLQFDQKAYSQPQSDMPSQIFHQSTGQAITHAAGGILGRQANDLRKHAPQGNAPQFIMRNPHVESKHSPKSSDYQGVAKNSVSKPLGISSISSVIKDISTNGTSYVSGSGKTSQPYQGQIKAQNGFNFMEPNTVLAPQAIMSSKTSTTTAQQQAAQGANLIKNGGVQPGMGGILGGVGASRSIQQP